MAWQALGARLGARHERLRTLLIDPTFVAGIGPVYADEILWAGGLRWDRESDSLTAQEVRRLHRAIQEVVQEAVRLRGVSVGETPWLDLHGGKGEFEPQLSVYQRDGQPCRRCRTPLVHERDPDAGRPRTIAPNARAEGPRRQLRRHRRPARDGPGAGRLRRARAGRAAQPPARPLGRAGGPHDQGDPAGPGEVPARQRPRLCRPGRQGRDRPVPVRAQGRRRGRVPPGRCPGGARRRS